MIAFSTQLRALELEVLEEGFVSEPVLTVSEWADENRALSPESSAEPGPWRTSRAPYLRGIMDAFSEPTRETVVVMSSSQIGKTEVVLNVLGYYVHQDQAPILVVYPNVEPMAHAFSKDRLAPMLRDSPSLQGLVAAVKSRDSANTILHKTFRGGHITIAGANSAAGLASRPIRVLLCDEVDRYPPSAGTEGDPVSLATRRATTFWNRKIGLLSTPGIRGFSRIEEAHDAGDCRKYHVPCPHCGHRQVLRWSGLKWESNRPETVGYVCGAGDLERKDEAGNVLPPLGCGALLLEEDKPRMLAGGEWVAEFPERAVASFHINALYSPWARWEEHVTEFLECRGNPERLKAFVMTVLGESWEERGEQVDQSSLRFRADTEGEFAAEVPAGVGVLTSSIDVQGDRLEFLVKGWGAGEESWRIDAGQYWGDPGQPDVWENVAELLTRRFQHEHGAVLQLASMMIDTGGHHAEHVYRFVAPRQARQVYALKGMGGEGRPLIGRPSRPNKQGVRLMPIGVDTAKDTIFSRLKIAKPGPGYMHLPSSVDDEELAQLTSEKVVRVFFKGRPRREYQKVRPRNEALDLEVYAFAALVVLGPAVFNNLGALAERLSLAGVPVEEEEVDTTPSPDQDWGSGGGRWGEGWG